MLPDNDPENVYLHLANELLHPVLVGLITGTVTVFVWKSVPGLTDLVYELIPAFFIALLSTIGVSLASKENQ